MKKGGATNLNSPCSPPSFPSESLARFSRTNIMDRSAYKFTEFKPEGITNGKRLLVKQMERE